MSSLELGFYSFPVLMLLIFMRAPIGLAMLICGLAGLYFISGDSVILLSKLKRETYTTFSNYNLSIVPMFLLMGQFASYSGMSSSLFRAAESWLGHRKGGVAMAAVGACAGFGAICGSSLATAATMSRVALPELRRYGYSGGFASATLAAGGTLGVLIPPSVVLVIYAILTEQNIEKMFAAALIPGIFAAISYMIAIAIYVRVFPKSAGLREREPYAARFRSMLDVWPVLILFGVVVGGIYDGWFSPTAGAAVGAAGAGLIAALKGQMNWRIFRESIISTAMSTAMIFFIIFGASIYNGFLASSRLPQELAGWIVGQGLSPWAVLWMILIFYLILGCLMDSLSMILLTIPIFFPVITALNFNPPAEFDPTMLSMVRAVPIMPAIGTLDFGMSPEQVAIWFGILVLVVVEVGLITPPVGMNLFVINGIDRSTPITDTYKSVMWFVTADLLRVVILVSFPIITLLLVH
ncbi:MAG: TRAP transporter large permease [Neomegalonema sp.]|nr:TRAP transporter large permease [Neomegalonema sp.]